MVLRIYSTFGRTYLVHMAYDSAPPMAAPMAMPAARGSMFVPITTTPVIFLSASSSFLSMGVV